MAYVTNTQIAPSNVFGALANFFAAAAEKLAARREFKRTVAELQALSGRELADLGLSRSEITRVALEAAYGK
ncbi:MAG TPA: DUF1127 domain-containing protein [Paracoccaceae bacterium]|nr:DUF1127 domain-containing protein [Paracoccaceae bacterium]